MITERAARTAHDADQCAPFLKACQSQLRLLTLTQLPQLPRAHTLATAMALARGVPRGQRAAQSRAIIASCALAMLLMSTSTHRLNMVEAHSLASSHTCTCHGPGALRAAARCAHCPPWLVPTAAVQLQLHAVHGKCLF